MGLICWTALVVLILDQGTKMLIQKSLEQFQTVPVIPGIFSFHYIVNYGAAFGILRHQTALLVGLTLLVLVATVRYRKEIARQPKFLRWGLALGLGGALGNLLDRLRLGGVVDFLDFHFWPVFNLADVAIVVGVGIIVMVTLRREWQEKRKRGIE